MELFCRAYYFMERFFKVCTRNVLCVVYAETSASTTKSLWERCKLHMPAPVRRRVL